MPHQLFLSLVHQHFCSRIQYLVHNYISISHISILSTSQHHHFIIHFVDNEFKKIYQLYSITNFETIHKT
jgi:hypothetical protein